MRKHSKGLVEKIRKLRSKGKTYGEINRTLHTNVAKSSLHWICKNTPLPVEYQEKITKLNIQNLGIARATSIAIRQAKREKILKQVKQINTPIAPRIQEMNTAKIALAFLCLGEASKSTNRHTFSLGSANPKIVTLFIELLDKCFHINRQKIRCTVQCRADQNALQLIRFWAGHTGIPVSQFYKSQIDKRTIGKPTRKSNYHGVLNVYYADKKIQLELESLADLVYNHVIDGPVVQR